MQKIRNILLITALGLLLFGAPSVAQTAQKVFIKTPNGKLVDLSVNGTKAVLGVKLLPTALQLTVTGQPAPDFLNQLSYAYHDDLGRTQHSAVLGWYLADDAAGANKTTVATVASYTPTLANLGKYLRAGVVAVANDGSGGTITGDEVFSPWLKVRNTFYENAYLGAGIRHMTINVVNVNFGASGHLVAGDEIAVFDGSVCCAHATVTAPIETSSGNILTLAASSASYGGDGFTPGHAIAIRVFSKANSATGDYPASLEFVDNTGAAVTAPVFTENETAFVKLTVSP